MKVPYEWIRDYIDVGLKPLDLAGRLTMAGLEVKSIEGRDGGCVFEIEVTSNRPDCLSICGIGREIGAILGLKLKPLGRERLKDVTLGKPIIRVEDRKGCPRYIGRIIGGAEVRPSPKWLSDKLQAAGLRPVNNVVDITNFCLLESGQPLHAFDYDKLSGQEIVVRRARQGEEITTIDGVKRKLDKDILVIADGRGAVAIAGVMGGRETEVTSSTKRILLESAYFDPPTIRRASKRLGVATESSYRFERGVDLGAVSLASERAAGLIWELAEAKEQSAAADVGVKKAKKAVIELRASRVNRVLGMNIPASKCVSILKRLGLEAKRKAKETLEVGIPSFRRDLKEEVDLIEELARVHGYDKVPETLCEIPVWSRGRQKGLDKLARDLIREMLVESGLNEIITYGLGSRDVYVKNFAVNEDEFPSVSNPLSAETQALRPTLMAGLIEVIAHNVNRKISDIRIFELGKRYFFDSSGNPREKDALSLALCGMRTKDWQKKEPFGVFDLKGIIEALFERMGISSYEFVAEALPWFSRSASAAIKIKGEEAGVLGELSKTLLSKYDLREAVFACELDLSVACPLIGAEKKFSELPRYPSITRDISLIVGENIPNAKIADLIRRTCGGLAVSVKPFDLYRGEQIPRGSKSISYSVEYRACDRTLTDEEINGLDRTAREALIKELDAKIR